MAQVRELGSPGSARLLSAPPWPQLGSAQRGQEGPLGAQLSAAREGPFWWKTLGFSSKIAPSPAGHKFGVLGPGLTTFGPMALLLARLGIVLDELGLPQGWPIHRLRFVTSPAGVP